MTVRAWVLHAWAGRERCVAGPAMQALSPWECRGEVFACAAWSMDMVLTQGEALGVTKPHQFQSSANRVAIICDFILGGAIICYYFNQKKLGLLFQLLFYLFSPMKEFLCVLFILLFIVYFYFNYCYYFRLFWILLDSFLNHWLFWMIFTSLNFVCGRVCTKMICQCTQNESLKSLIFLSTHRAKRLVRRRPPPPLVHFQQYARRIHPPTYHLQFRRVTKSVLTRLHPQLLCHAVCPGGTPVLEQVVYEDEVDLSLMMAEHARPPSLLVSLTS